MFIQIILDKRKVRGVNKKETTRIAIKLCKMVKPITILQITKTATNKATAIP